MKKPKILIFFVILILIGIATLCILYLTKNITAKAINRTEQYSYTKAICNNTNYCQDYEIFCNGKELIDKKPITGAAVQFSDDWKDPRDEKIIDYLC